MSHFSSSITLAGEYMAMFSGPAKLLIADPPETTEEQESNEPLSPCDPQSKWHPWLVLPLMCLVGFGE